jgi:two-component system, chemotaxis family, CheB/CheR fusion protein
MLSLPLLARSYNVEQPTKHFGRASLPAEHMDSLRVLIVDDNQDAADSLAVLCRLWGHAVSVAYDGPTALTLAEHFEPQVVLLDIRMPGMHGPEVARQLRSNPKFARATLYATSANTPNDRWLQEWMRWFDGHLLKPYNLMELEVLLAQRAKCQA